MRQSTSQEEVYLLELESRIEATRSLLKYTKKMKNPDGITSGSVVVQRNPRGRNLSKKKMNPECQTEDLGRVRDSFIKIE